MSVYTDKKSINRAMHNLSRGQATVIIPAWMKGDRVLHRPTGFYGMLLEPATAGAELWKMEVQDARQGSDAAAFMAHARRPYCMQVHASDLELRT